MRNITPSNQRINDKNRDWMVPSDNYEYDISGFSKPNFETILSVSFMFKDIDFDKHVSLGSSAPSQKHILNCKINGEPHDVIFANGKTGRVIRFNERDLKTWHEIATAMFTGNGFTVKIGETLENTIIMTFTETNSEQTLDITIKHTPYKDLRPDLSHDLSFQDSGRPGFFRPSGQRNHPLLHSPFHYSSESEAQVPMFFDHLVQIN